MKITHKISFLFVFLLIVLAVNTLVGLGQLMRVDRELKNVVREDAVLIEAATSIAHGQMEKAVLFERALRAVEEIGFGNVPPARREYLLDHIRFTHKAIENLSLTGRKDIEKGLAVIEKGVNEQPSRGRNVSWRRAGDLLKKIDGILRDYDAWMQEFLALTTGGEHRLSFDDLEAVQEREQDLSFELTALLEEVREFMRESLSRAENAQRLAGRIFWGSLILSLLAGFLISLSIIRRISKPLEHLALAAHQIGVGNFLVNLEESSHDEIGEVSRAFNTMTRKLLEYKEEVENKNKVLQENLRTTSQQKRDLEKVNRELDNFVHTVSHDIRAPLMGMAGYGAYLERHYKDQLDQKGQDCVNGVIRASYRLNTLIQDLLTLTKIARVRNPYETVRVNEILDSISDRLEFDIRKYSVDFRVQANMPEIVCDRIKLTEAFFNLINNAIKFSSKNSTEPPKVEVGYHEREEAHEFYVRDNGIGIAPEHHAEIFGIFKRLHDASEYEGTGAGLSIVKTVIEDHGGRIWIESDFGKGATFYFTIPKELHM